MKKLLCIILSSVIMAVMLCSCTAKTENTPDTTTTLPAVTNNSEPAAVPKQEQQFRITAYVVADKILDYDSFDTSHFYQLTDVILFGCARYDEQGKVTLLDNFDKAYENIKKACEPYPDINLYLNILGPGYNIDSNDWNKQMNNLSERNTNAFNSGNLQGEILDVMQKYSFDGVFFDYEYPLKAKYWKAYDNFIISLNNTLGDEYKIGIAVAHWNANQSKQAIAATDMVEVMAYDLWDDDGTHASLSIATQAIEKMVKLGYDKSQLDLGVPFYARPTTEEAYWYDYRSYYDKLDENGFFSDSKTNLTFSFNTYDVIAEKTQWAMSNGVGGIMVWHYSCDLPESNDKSLFNAIHNTKQGNK